MQGTFTPHESLANKKKGDFLHSNKIINGLQERVISILFKNKKIKNKPLLPQRCLPNLTTGGHV